MYGPCLCGALDCVPCRGSSAREYLARLDSDDWAEAQQLREEAEEAERIEKSERYWLQDIGYELDEDFVWHRTLSQKTRTARRDHKSGHIKKGDRYHETRIRTIDDLSGESRHERIIYLIRAAA